MWTELFQGQRQQCLRNIGATIIRHRHIIGIWDPLSYCEQHMANPKASVLVPAIIETKLACLTTEIIVHVRFLHVATMSPEY